MSEQVPSLPRPRSCGMSAYQHYLVFVVRHEFGPLVQQLASTLLTHGPLTLPAVIHHSTLTPSQARKALLILIQHNIVVADYEHRPSPPPSSSSSSSSFPPPLAPPPTEAAVDPLSVRVLYRVHDTSLRCRPRFPSYVQTARERLGEDAGLLVQALCTKGILTTPQLLDHALALHQQGQAEGGAGSSSAPAAGVAGAGKHDELEAALHRLVSLRFVKRALMAKASGEHKGGDDDDEEKEYFSTAEMKKRKREEEKKEKERAKASTARMDDGREEKKTKPRGRKKKEADNDERLQREADLLRQQQRQREEEEEETERRRRQQADPNGIPDHWMLNDSTFTAETQREAMLSYVRERISPTSAFVLAALMRMLPYESIRPPVLEEGRIMEAVGEHAAAAASPPKVTPSSLRPLLQELTTDPAHPLQAQGATSYSVDFPSFLSHLQLLQTQSILSSRFSLLASRIYRVLLLHSRLEESQLAELCTASRQSVRETLHELMKEEWVLLYEVPRTVDRAPSKTFFLWGVDRRKVKERVRELMYTSAVKVMEREAKEREEVADVMSRLNMQQRIGDKERRQVERWNIAQERLEMAQKHIQHTLAVWHE